MLECVHFTLIRRRHFFHQFPNGRYFGRSQVLFLVLSRSDRTPVAVMFY